MRHQKQLMIDLLIVRLGPTGYSLVYLPPKKTWLQLGPWNMDWKNAE